MQKKTQVQWLSWGRRCDAPHVVVAGPEQAVRTERALVLSCMQSCRILSELPTRIKKVVKKRAADVCSDMWFLEGFKANRGNCARYRGEKTAVKRELARTNYRLLLLSTSQQSISEQLANGQSLVVPHRRGPAGI